MPSDTSSIQTVAEVPSPVTSDREKDPGKDQNNLDQFPEGGTAAWCAVVGGMLAQICCFGYNASFGVYQEFYTLNYLTNESASAISWIGSVNAFMICAIGPLVGMLYDRGYFYQVLIGGSLLQSISLFILSLAQPGQYYQIFLAQGVALGLAQGMVYVPTIAVVSHYFHRRRTLAMTLVACGSSLGAVIHPIMLNYLFNGGVGFANGVRISAALITVLLLISCLLIRTRLDPPQHPTSYLSVAKGIIRDVPFCIMGAGFLFFQIGFYFPVFYLQLDSILHGNSETFSFYSLVLLNGGSLIGRLSSGFIEPRVSVPKLMILSTATCGILILGMIGLSGIPTVVILSTIYGYFAGIYIALLAPLIAFLTSDISELGARMGLGITVAGLGALASAITHGPPHMIAYVHTGGPVSGALLTSQYKWWKPALFNGLVSLVGCFLLTMMEFTRVRRVRATERQDVEQEV